MIKRLKLTNYRQHTNTIVEFGPGINTIVGANNAGKSTIPEAIEFVLYGAKAQRDSGNSWITDGCKSGNAILDLEINEDEYRIGRDAVAAKVLKNKEPEADCKANVTRYMTQLTGVSHAGFRLGHYVRQKELAAFSQLRAGKRQETIEKMLRINAVDRVLTTIKSEIDMKEVELKAQLTAAQDVDILTEELTQTEITRAALVPIDVVPQETIVSEARTALASSREEYARLEAQKEELDRLRSSLAQLPSLREKYLQAGEELALFEPEFCGTVEDLEARLRVLQKNEVLAAKMSTIKKELDAPLTAVEVPVKVDSTEYDARQSAISAANVNFQTVNKLKGLTKCPTCLTEIADVDGLIRSLAETRDKAIEEAQPIIQAHQEAVKKYAEAERKYLDYLRDSKRRAQLLEQFVEVEFSDEEKKQTEKELAGIRDSNAKLVRLNHDVNMLEVHVRTLEKMEPRLAELENVFCSDAFASASAAVRENTEKLAAENAVLVELKQQATKRLTDIARLDGRIDELLKQVESARMLRETIADIADEIAKLKYKFEVYQKFKKYLTAKIRPKIGTVAEALFHRVTKNRYASYQLSNDYEVILNTHGGFVRKLTTISGSENDLANLCLRLAIATLRSNRLVGNLGFIILDEISSSFDDERTRQTLEGLLELRDIIPQIINITHKPVEVRFADKLITVVENNGRASIV